MVLIMSVEPGFGGQSFIERAVARIRAARELIGDADIWLQVDGGVSAATIERCAAAGADVFVAGSAVYAADGSGCGLRGVAIGGAGGQPVVSGAAAPAELDAMRRALLLAASPGCRRARTPASAVCCWATTARLSLRASTGGPAPRTRRSAALHQAGGRAAGATAVVTLEPCNHTGRTGPCSEALHRGRSAAGGLRAGRSEPRGRGRRRGGWPRRASRCSAECWARRRWRSIVRGASPSATAGRWSPGRSPAPSTGGSPRRTGARGGSPDPPRGPRSTTCVARWTRWSSGPALRSPTIRS